MLVIVRLVLQYDNFEKLAEDLDYEILGEEILLERNISVECETFNKIVADLRNVMFEYELERNSRDIIFKEGVFHLQYKILNISKTQSKSCFNEIVEAFKEYLDRFEEEATDAAEEHPSVGIEDGNLLNIETCGMALSLEELKIINDYLKEQNIDYELIELNSSSIEAGAGGGFSNLLLVLSSAADFLTVITAIKDLLNNEESPLVVERVSNVLYEQAQELISQRYNIYIEQVLFVEQKNSGNSKLFVFETLHGNKYYKVLFDEKNKLKEISSTVNINDIE